MIESTIYSWLGNLSAPLYPVLIPDDKEAPGVVYRIESEFTPDDGKGPFGATGHRVRLSIWHPSYKSSSQIASEARDILNGAHDGFLVSVEDRGDFVDSDTTLYGIVLDVEITTLKPVTEAPQLDHRGAAKKLIINHTNALEHVFATRIGFANNDSFPCVGISIQDVNIETDNADQDFLFELIVNVKTVSSVDSENQLETLVKQIQARLHPDIKLNNDARINLKRIATSYSAVGRLHYEHRIMSFDLQYFEAIPNIEDLPEFEYSGVDWNIDDDIEAEAKDLLPIP
jgi:hypothetical protein